MQHCINSDCTKISFCLYNSLASKSPPPPPPPLAHGMYIPWPDLFHQCNKSFQSLHSGLLSTVVRILQTHNYNSQKLLYMGILVSSGSIIDSTTAGECDMHIIIPLCVWLCRSQEGQCNCPHDQHRPALKKFPHKKFKKIPCIYSKCKFHTILV